MTAPGELENYRPVILSPRAREREHPKRLSAHSPRVWVELRRRGWVVGVNRVARIMADLGLQGRSGRRAVPRTTVADPDAAPAPNRLARDFSPEGPDRTWVTDITYVKTAEGWCYLAAIVDCYSRLVVGWALADHMRTELCVDAFVDADSQTPSRSRIGPPLRLCRGFR